MSFAKCALRSILSFTTAIVMLQGVVRADIYEWEFINPADPSQGKKQSSNLTPDGAGVVAEPRATLYGLDLTKAYLIEAELCGANFGFATLTDADLSHSNVTGANFLGAKLNNVQFSNANLTKGNFQGTELISANLSDANLTDSYFVGATLTNAKLSGTDVRGADFLSAIGLTAAQLYSTASYRSGDLSGIRLENNDLTGWNFAGQNLTNARFGNAKLTDADFTDADVRGAWFGKFNEQGPENFSAAQLYSTESYQDRGLTGIRLSTNLTGWNFAGQKLRTARMGGILTGANFTGADVQGAFFEYATRRGFTADQLYSTASYQTGDLTDIVLSGTDLSGWNFAGQDLTNAGLYDTTLLGTNFSGADLTRANLFNSRLADANFAGAEVRHATFRGTVLTAAQLYSTASYQSGDLTGIDLGGMDRTGWNFSGKNLTDAKFDYGRMPGADLSQANLTNADFEGTGLESVNFTGADVRGAKFAYTTGLGFTASQLYSTASYQAGDLTGISFKRTNLSGWDFSQQNLTNASFDTAWMPNASFAGAIVRGTNFRLSGLTEAMLYSTASYQQRNLTGIVLLQNDLTGWNFAHQNLTNAEFGSSNFSSANFYGADTRGASGLGSEVPLDSNMIRPNGSIQGLTLTDMQSLTVRNYAGDPDRFNAPLAPIPIQIQQHVTMDATGTLALLFNGDPWHSLISFSADIPVELGGTLELEFTADVNVATQIGRAIRIFDWSGVSPVDRFDVVSPYTWDLSQLYTTGEVRLAAISELPADYNADVSVDAADYVLWRKNRGTDHQFDTWRANFGASYNFTRSAELPSVGLDSATVPEPLSASLLAPALIVLIWSGCRVGLQRELRNNLICAAEHFLPVSR